MIETIISEFFTKMGWTWNLKGGRVVTPTEVDVSNALTEAAKALYDQPHQQLEVGRLIIQRGHTQAKDVFMYVGTYY